MAETEFDTVIHSELAQHHMANGHCAGLFKPEALSPCPIEYCEAAPASASVFLLPAPDSDGCLDWPVTYTWDLPLPRAGTCSIDRRMLGPVSCSGQQQGHRNLLDELQGGA